MPLNEPGRASVSKAAMCSKTRGPFVVLRLYDRLVSENTLDLFNVGTVAVSVGCVSESPEGSSGAARVQDTFPVENKIERGEEPNTEAIEQTWSREISSHPKFIEHPPRVAPSVRVRRKKPCRLR